MHRPALPVLHDRRIRTSEPRRPYASLLVVVTVTLRKAAGRYKLSAAWPTGPLALISVLAISGCGGNPNPVYRPASLASCLSAHGATTINTASWLAQLATDVSGKHMGVQFDDGEIAAFVFGRDSADARRIEHAFHLEGSSSSKRRGNLIVLTPAHLTVAKRQLIAGCETASQES